ncbi:MAG: ABC transporter ATP-binding protein [Desulfovibrio sp.]|jgi:heme exporter protein A|nr:ABC transporter ATP-binding protein [Desulfovibrio sp.]
MLEMQGIAKFYGDKAVLENISCSFTAGSVSLLIGGNGAGKSTLVRIMAGLSRPSAGTARFTGEAASSRPRRTGYLGHATFLYPGLTALENLRFWSDAGGMDLGEDDLLAVLGRVGLAPCARERSGVFSRGMAQRLNLARVLMPDPDMLLLDEPGTGLDAASRVFLHQEVLAARARGACVVLVSHDVAADAPLADRILLLDNRKLAFDGSPSDYDAAVRAEGEPCCA